MTIKYCIGKNKRFTNGLVRARQSLASFSHHAVSLRVALTPTYLFGSAWFLLEMIKVPPWTRWCMAFPLRSKRPPVVTGSDLFLVKLVWRTHRCSHQIHFTSKTCRTSEWSYIMKVMRLRPMALPWQAGDHRSLALKLRLEFWWL